MRTLIAFLAIVATFSTSACSSRSQPSSPSNPPPGATLQGAGQGPDAPPCNFKVGDACFADAESACTSAGCDTTTCRQAESHPVQVSCP